MTEKRKIKKNIEVPEITTQYDTLKTVIKYFKISIKIKHIVNQVLEIMNFQVFIVSWKLTILC